MNLPADPRVSVIMPVLNEASLLPTTLASLQTCRARGWEVIVVDGGSQDASRGIAAPLVDQLLSGEACRATQMNLGAAQARAPMLCFVHADTRLCDSAITALEQIAGERCWGRFSLRLDHDKPAYRVIERFIRARSRLTGVVTGDQVLFVSKALFDSVGGYPPIALMEDVALSKKLREFQAPRCLRARVLSSARRWQQNGLLRTVLLMWKLRWQYYRGVSPEQLLQQYRGR